MLLRWFQLDLAGLPLIAYCGTSLELRDHCSVRTRNGVTVDRDGTVKNDTYGGSDLELLTQYYYMEYNGHMAGSDFVAELFSILGIRNNCAVVLKNRPEVMGCDHGL